MRYILDITTKAIMLRNLCKTKILVKIKKINLNVFFKSLCLGDFYKLHFAKKFKKDDFLEFCRHSLIKFTNLKADKKII